MKTSDWSNQIGAWADAWHEDLVKFLARRTAARADAEDLAQEVYLRLLRVDRHAFVRQPRSYLLRIAANLLHEWRLKARQSRPHETLDPESLEAADSPEQAAIAQNREARLEEEMSRLTPPVRAALVLQIREGLSYEEIAARMNVTQRMVKRYLLAAYGSLRTQVPPDL
jgi:RNA polymerase sigma factor (sigma-70 family)